MKAHSRNSTHCQKKTSSTGRLHPQAGNRQQHPASVQPIPAIRAQYPFTIEEHLRVQVEIEQRAHQFWSAKGRTSNNALNDWLKAESDVLAEFARTRMQSRPTRHASGETQTTTRRTSALPPTDGKSTSKPGAKSIYAMPCGL